MISRRFALVVVVIAVLVAASFQYLNARAAQPGSGEVGPSALTATTDFAPVVGSSGGATQVAQECPPEVCDNYDLKVDAPKAGTKGSLTITYTWTNSTAGGTDLDVFAISPDGTIAGPGSPDTQPVGDGEEVLTIDASQPGTYNIRSVAGTAPTATAAHAVMTMAYTAIPKGPGPLTNQLSFAPASTV
ncbi:MAG TPA: hypothetical protein VG815_04120, partial [Chloroflexota bacterium]|nr:hypothetical protein [Chloroflexota bacterium]